MRAFRLHARTTTYARAKLSLGTPRVSFLDAEVEW
jgi:hypothetical protein